MVELSFDAVDDADDVSEDVFPPESDDTSTSDKRPNERLNYSVSAYRVLYILVLLVKHRSLSLEDLNDKLMDCPAIGRPYNGETITKYINTLRSVGCHIPRTKSRYNFEYVLSKSPFLLSFDLPQLLAALKLQKVLSYQPDEALHVAFVEFLQKLTWALSDEQTALLLDVDDDSFDEGLQEQRRRLSTYRALCQDGYVLQLTYDMGEGSLVKLVVAPYRVTQIGTVFYLLGFDQKNFKEVRLMLSGIVDYTKLSYKSRNTIRSVKVTFRLLGRLARTYRLYKGEEIVASTFSPKKNTDKPLESSCDDIYLDVCAKVDDVHGFLNRLMKYADRCEVLAPAYVRQEMVRKLNALLRAVEAPALEPLSLPEYSSEIVLNASSPLSESTSFLLPSRALNPPAEEP